MPKLAKIRLTGCHYDGMTKEHENSIFDLTKDGEADHTLFTLLNGGGKGVMMQLIFQLLLPETKWGENNGNKVISMFYDKRTNLHPFTFHVVLEWILDTIPEKRLITGIAVKAVLKNTGNDEEEKTGLAYFLYTHEHDNNGYFSVENLPLYNESTGGAVDAELLENFIDEYKQYFTKYSQSSVRRKDAPYFTYLESRGIYRSEWINLKNINKSEGGARGYFVGASDNKSIFDKVIIPVISEHIRNYTYEEEESLIKMFKSNLSITKDLPVLIKREGDYKDLLVEIKPLIENADSGSRFWDMRDRCIDEGNDIYFILKEEETRITQEIEKWSLEVRKAENERKELAFKKDNLIYNQERLSLEAEILESQKLEEKLTEKSRQLEQEEAELKLYEINELLGEKKYAERQIALKKEEKERLVDALDISDIKLRAAQLDTEIKLEWEKTESNWKNHEKQYFGYVNYLDQELQKNNKLKKQYAEQVNILQNEINKFEIKEQDLDKERRKLEQSGYDSLSLFYPERIVADLIKIKAELENEITQLSAQVLAYKEQEVGLGLEINQLEYRSQDKLKNVASLDEKAKEVEKYELDLARRVTKRLLENYEGNLLNHDWFSAKLASLEELGQQNQGKLEQVQKAIWEQSIDKFLNQEDYFIPNKDVVLIKQEIMRLGIYVETGSEYLQGLDEQEKINVLHQHPGFLFSVVIKNSRDWELIEKNISSDLFLNNMVPIYIRSAMASAGSNTFKSLSGKAIELINYSQYVAWQEAIEKNLTDLSQVTENIKNDLGDIEILKDELKIIAKNDTAWIINQRIKQEENEIAQLADEIRIKKEEKLGVINRLSQAEADLKANNNNLNQTNNDITHIQRYIEKLSEVEEERLIIKKVKQEQNRFKQDIADIEDKTENLQNDQKIINHAYLEWKIVIRDIVQKVKEFLEKAEYKEEVEEGYLNLNIPNLSVASDKLLGLVQTRKAVEADIASKNSSIAVLDEAIKHLNETIEKSIKKLRKISGDWIEYLYLELPVNELQIRVDKVTKNIQKLRQETSQTKSIYDRTMGSINSQKDQLSNQEVRILKEHQRPVIIWEIEDMASAMDLVERDIQSNQKYALVCSETLNNNENTKNKLSLNLSNIKNHYSLDVTKGKIEDILKEKIQQNPDLVVEEWLRKYNKNMDQINKTQNEGESLRAKFIKRVESSLEEDQLKDKIITTIKEAKIFNFKSNLISFKSMENHFGQELNRLTRDKSKAEEVMKQWTHRASIHVLRMVEALKDMVASMNYINEQGYAFPLVKLKGVDRLPREESEVSYLLNEYFVQAIAKIIEGKRDITTLDDYELKELMGDKIIFSKALQGRYPILLVYKMSENNEFRYARARDEYYTTWEALNKGEGYSPEGSGGQTLSVTTFVIMMLMSFKKKHLGNENPSTVLILDNPFGKASTKHVVDPIFEIADKLDFQLICFAPPEIIKVEISERFPIFWELKIEKGKVIHGGRVIMGDN